MYHYHQLLFLNTIHREIYLCNYHEIVNVPLMNYNQAKLFHKFVQKGMSFQTFSSVKL